jgi:uncharacterized membrane protein
MIEDDERTGNSLSLGRTLALSDGIFAIAMTLLAFQVQPPNLSGSQVHHLATALGDLSSRYYVYLLSFAVIGLFWLAHHRLFGYLERVDESFTLINLVVLMAMAALPFPSAVLGRYASQRVAVILYAASMAVTGSLMMGLWIVADRRGLLSERASRTEINGGLWRGASTAIVFGLSIPVAVVSPSNAPFCWIAVPILRFWPKARRRRAARAAT